MVLSPCVTLLCGVKTLSDLKSDSAVTYTTRTNVLTVQQEPYKKLFSDTYRRGRRTLSTENELYVAAVNALARRAHSVHEMKTLLARRTEDEKLIRAVVDKLKDHSYLDDARYALEFTRSRVRTRRQGRFRIARELRTRGVPDAPIEAALELVFAETDESALVRAKLQRMAKSRGPLDARKIASIYRSLLRAGFGGDVIQKEIRALGAADVESDPEPAGNSDPA